MRFIKRYFSHLTSQFSSQKGFSLVELLIYMGILSVLIGVLSTLLGNIFDVQLDSSSSSSVDQDTRYIHAKLIHDFQTNDPVIIKVPLLLGVPSQSLRINANGEATDTTYSIDGNGNLVLTNNAGTFNLNSEGTSISNLSATRIGTGGDNDTVRVSFTVTSRTHETSGNETRTFQSTFAGHKEN